MTHVTGNSQGTPGQPPAGFDVSAILNRVPFEDPLDEFPSEYAAPAAPSDRPLVMGAASAARLGAPGVAGLAHAPRSARRWGRRIAFGTAGAATVAMAVYVGVFGPRLVDLSAPVAVPAWPVPPALQPAAFAAVPVPWNGTVPLAGETPSSASAQ